MDGLRFERDIVKCFNTYFETSETCAIAYRIERASHYTIQPADVFVDSPYRTYYLAIECKSFKPKGSGRKLYFSSAFSDATGVPQLERMQTFLHKSGRVGLVAVEVSARNRLNAYLLPFNFVYQLSKRDKGLSLAFIEEKGRHLIRKEGRYFF
jgi:hypothetical protein